MKVYCKSCGDIIDEVDSEATGGTCYYCHRANVIIKNIKEVKEIDTRK